MTKRLSLAERDRRALVKRQQEDQKRERTARRREALGVLCKDCGGKVAPTLFLVAGECHHCTASKDRNQSFLKLNAWMLSK